MTTPHHPYEPLRARQLAAWTRVCHDLEIGPDGSRPEVEIVDLGLFWGYQRLSVSSPNSVEITLLFEPDFVVWVASFPEYMTVVPDDIDHPTRGVEAMIRMALTSEVRIRRRWFGLAHGCSIRPPGQQWTGSMWETGRQPHLVHDREYFEPVVRVEV